MKNSNPICNKLDLMILTGPFRLGFSGPVTSSAVADALLMLFRTDLPFPRDSSSLLLR